MIDARSQPSGSEIADVRHSKIQHQGFNAIRISAVAVSAILWGGSLSLNAFDTPGWTFNGSTEIYHNAASKIFFDGIIALFVVVFILIVKIPYIFLPAVATIVYFLGKREIALTSLLLMIAIAACFRLVSWCAWLANTALACSWCLYLMARYRAATAYSAVSGILAASFLFVGKVPYGPKDYSVEISSYGEGYWMWLGSIAVMIVCCSVDYWLVKKSMPQIVRDGLKKRHVAERD